MVLGTLVRNIVKLGGLANDLHFVRGRCGRVSAHFLHSEGHLLLLIAVDVVVARAFHNLLDWHRHFDFLPYFDLDGHLNALLDELRGMKLSAIRVGGDVSVDIPCSYSERPQIFGLF